MEILCGRGRGMNLKVPDGMEVRPTSVRSRRALFDMLGDLSGQKFCDLFAGSGAMGIEAASRGASHVTLIEKSAHVLSVLRDNVRRAQAWSSDSVFQIIPGTIPVCFSKITKGCPSPDLVFGDPPYAESMELLDQLLRQTEFNEWIGAALMLWEMPDNRGGLKILPDSWQLRDVRELGASRFLLLSRKKINKKEKNPSFF